MATRPFSRLLSFLKTPEVQFFLIALVPLATSFVLAGLFVRQGQANFLQLVIFGMFGLVLFQVLYSMYARAKDKEQEHMFLRIVAHQLRTPLTTVRWIVSEATKDSLKAEEKADLRRMGDSSVSKINAIVDAFLVSSKADRRQDPSMLAELDMCDVIEQVVEEIEPVARQFGVDVHFEGPCDELWVKVNPTQLEIVFSNLLTNGIRYNHRGGIVAVSARRAKGGSFVEVSVRDSGMGIPAAEQSHVFDKFFRGEQAQRFDAAGSGLGLSVTRDIVEQYGGKIWLESMVGKGTTFHFTLPASRV